jgi:hypothetical protein
MGVENGRQQVPSRYWSLPNTKHGIIFKKGDFVDTKLLILLLMLFILELLDFMFLSENNKVIITIEHILL